MITTAYRYVATSTKEAPTTLLFLFRKKDSKQYAKSKINKT